jgi:hypothetical protein
MPETINPLLEAEAERFEVRQAESWMEGLIAILGIMMAFSFRLKPTALRMRLWESVHLPSPRYGWCKDTLLSNTSLYYPFGDSVRRHLKLIWQLPNPRSLQYHRSHVVRPDSGRSACFLGLLAVF